MEITLKINLLDLNEKQRTGLFALIGEAPDVDEPVVADDLDSDQLDELVHDMLEEGLKLDAGSRFRIPELYRMAKPLALWNDLTPSDRKVLGRRFKKIVDAQDIKAEGTFIQLSGKTIQNSAIYAVMRKKD